MAKRRERTVPKRIAGVKVPKALRRPAATLLQVAESPVLGDAIAAAIVAGTEMIAEGKGRRQIFKAAALGAGAAAVTAAHGASRFPLALAVAAGEVAANWVGAWGEESEAKAKPGRRQKSPRTRRNG